MRFIALLLLLPSCAAHPIASNPPEPEVKTISVGAIDLIPLGKSRMEDVIVGDRRVGEVWEQREFGNVAFASKKTGSTSLEILGRDGEPSRKVIYDVISSEVAHQLYQVTELLRGIRGIAVNDFGGIVRISGALIDPDTVVNDYERIYQAEQLFSCLNTVTISDALYEKAAEKMQREIDKLDGGSAVKVRVLNGTFLLEGSAPSPEAKDRAEAMVTTLLPPILSRASFKESALILGAKKYSIRNLIRVNDRSPASACPKN